MQMKWSELDIPTLKGIYEKEAADLKAALISGSSWEELREQRQKVTDLAIALHKKRFFGANPAESSLRKEE